MKVLFAGTPEFAARCLESILRSRHTVCSVLTQPDRPAGRGLAPATSATKKLAQARGLAVDQPVSLRDERLRAELGRRGAEVLVVAAYGLILPKEMLEITRHGAVNIHASLLPRWRGAAPIQRAILAGDRETGVSIMQMDEHLDSGPVMLQKRIAISDEDTAGTLHDRLATLGGELIVEALGALEAGKISPSPQPVTGVTYARKLDKSEFRVRWNDDALKVHRLIRALSPAPRAHALIRGTQVKLRRCAVVPEQGDPGKILRIGRDGIVVACGENAVLLTELQRPGGKPLPAAEFLRGFPLSAGERFEAA